MPNYNSCVINDRASFLPVKSSTVNLVNHWAIVGALDDEVLVGYLNVDPSPPTSTSTESRYVQTSS